MNPKKKERFLFSICCRYVVVVVVVVAIMETFTERENSSDWMGGKQGGRE